MIDRLNLSPRQIRTALDLVTGAVVISVAFALAGLTWRIAGYAGTGAITVPSGASAPAASDVTPALGLFGKASPSDATQPTALPLELKGIVAAEPADRSTAFIAASGQPAQPYHIGQSVGGATIQGILRDRVILSSAGRIEYLGFPVPVPTAAPAAPITPGGAPVAAAPVSGPPPADSAGNLSAMLQHFGASPAEGGYRIGANAPPGLSQGDVIQSINGTALTDPAAASAAFAGAQGTGSANIVILRDGKRLTLTVPIR